MTRLENSRLFLPFPAVNYEISTWGELDSPLDFFPDSWDFELPFESVPRDLGLAPLCLSRLLDLFLEQDISLSACSSQKLADVEQGYEPP